MYIYIYIHAIGSNTVLYVFHYFANDFTELIRFFNIYFSIFSVFINTVFMCEYSDNSSFQLSVVRQHFLQ